MLQSATACIAPDPSFRLYIHPTDRLDAVPWELVLIRREGSHTYICRARGRLPTPVYSTTFPLDAFFSVVSHFERPISSIARRDMYNETYEQEVKKVVVGSVGNGVGIGALLLG
jgi:hypothetical protein